MPVSPPRRRCRRAHAPLAPGPRRRPRRPRARRRGADPARAEPRTGRPGGARGGAGGRHVGAQAEDRRHQRAGARCRPRLRPAARRVGRGTAEHGVRAVELRPAVPARGGHVDEGPSHPSSGVAEPGSCETEAADRGVVGPHRAGVVPDRVERGVAPGEGRDAERAEQVRAREGRRDPRLARRAERAGAEDVADVAAQAVDRRAVAVEGHREDAAPPGVGPERRLDARGEGLGPGAPAPAVGAEHLLEEVGRGVGRLDGVGLRLDEGDRALGDAPGGVAHRVAGVLPALVGQTGAGLVEVAQEAVRAAVGRALHPAERCVQGGLELADHRGVHPPPPRVVEQADPERGGVDGAVVGGRQNHAALAAERGAPDLVRDLAGCLGGDRGRRAAPGAGRASGACRGRGRCRTGARAAPPTPRRARRG